MTKNRRYLALALAFIALVVSGTGAQATSQAALTVDEAHPEAWFEGGSLSFGVPAFTPPHLTVNPVTCAHLPTCDVIPLDLTPWTAPPPPPCPAGPCVTRVYPSYLQVSLVWPEPALGDLDLYIFDRDTPGAEPVGQSTSATDHEVAFVSEPAGGRYWLVVNNYVGINPEGYSLIASFTPGSHVRL